MVINKYITPHKSTNSLRRDFDNMIDALFNAPMTNLGGMTQSSDSLNSKWSPSVDIKETANEYKVIAEVPGVNPKDIKVSLDKNTLTIEGEKTVEDEKEDSNWHRVERFSGSFCRQFTLPNNIDADSIKAKTKHGLLELTIPKAERVETKYVNIESDE